MTVELPTYIPLSKAARRYRISAKDLTNLIEKGTIRAVKVNGRVAVAEGDVARVVKRDELWQRVKHLDGKPIGMEEACTKYRLSSPSVYRWIELGYVRVLEDQRGGGRGRKRALNEADVAYAALVAEVRGKRRGRRIFTREFVPPHAAST
jgi:predicted site-specific integrase-resolvase